MRHASAVSKHGIPGMTGRAYASGRIGIPVADLIARAEGGTGVVDVTGDAVLDVLRIGDGEFDRRASRDLRN